MIARLVFVRRLPSSSCLKRQIEERHVPHVGLVLHGFSAGRSLQTMHRTSCFEDPDIIGSPSPSTHVGREGGCASIFTTNFISVREWLKGTANSESS